MYGLHPHPHVAGSPPRATAMRVIVFTSAIVIIGVSLGISRLAQHSPSSSPAPAVLPISTQPSTTATDVVESTVPVAATTPFPLSTPASRPAATNVPTTIPATTQQQPLDATPSSTTISEQPLAIDLLAFITVANEHRGDGYSRDLFGYPASDGGGCDTRAKVLVRDSLTAAQVDPSGCTVVAGDWTSVYDGITTSSPGDLEIDHVVSLKEAWDSGAWQWDEATRHAYANDLSDPRTLRAVTVDTNRAKGDKDPSNWLPPDESDVCRYISDWVAIKLRWNFSMDQSEYGRIRNLLKGPCAGTQVVPSAAVTVRMAPTPATTPTSVLPIAAPSVYYANCTEARSAGAAPILAGEPGYRAALDRDHDGIACE